MKSKIICVNGSNMWLCWLFLFLRNDAGCFQNFAKWKRFFIIYFMELHCLRKQSIDLLWGSNSMLARNDFGTLESIQIFEHRICTVYLREHLPVKDTGDNCWLAGPDFLSARSFLYSCPPNGIAIFRFSPLRMLCSCPPNLLCSK